MKLIINADPEDAPAVLAMMLDHRDAFERRPERLGWGWVWPIANGKQFFVRQIKGGLSATQVRITPDDRS